MLTTLALPVHAVREVRRLTLFMGGLRQEPNSDERGKNQATDEKVAFQLKPQVSWCGR